MGLFDKFKSPKKPLKGGKKKKKKVVKTGKKPAKNPKPKKNKKGKLTIDDLNVNPVLEDNLYKIMDTAMDDPDEPYVAKADMDGEYYVYGLALNDKLIKENDFDQGQPTILSQIKTGLDIGGKHGADADGALVNASFDHDLHSNTDHQIVFMPTVKTLQNLESIGGSDAKYQVTIIPADISSENFDEYFEQGLINANLSEDDGTPMELTIDGFKDLTESLDNDPAFKKNEGVEDDLGDDDLDNDNDLDNDDNLGDFDPDTSMPDDDFSPDDNGFDDSSSTNPDDDFGDNSLPDDGFDDTSLTSSDDGFGDNSLPNDSSSTTPDDGFDDNSLLGDDSSNTSSTNPDDELDDTPLINPDDDFNDNSLPDDDSSNTSSTNPYDSLDDTSSTNPDTSNADDMPPIDSDGDDFDSLGLLNNDGDLGDTNPSELDENNGEDDDDAPVFDEDDKSEEPEDNGNSNDEPSGESNIDKFLNNDDLNDELDEPVTDGGDSNNEPDTDDGNSSDKTVTDDGNSSDEPEDNGDSSDEPVADDSNDEPEEPVEPEKPKTLGEQNLNNFIAHNIIKLDAALDSLDTERFRVDTDSDSSSTVGYKSLYNDLLSSQIKREKEYIRSRYKQEIGQLLDPYVNPASFAGHFIKVNQLLEDKFMSPSEMAKQTEESKASISARYEEIHQDLLEKAQAKAEMEFANRYEPECQRELAEAEKAVTVKHQQEYDEAVQKVLNKLFFDNQASLTSQSQKIITRLIDEDIPNANLALTSQAKAYSEEMVRYAQFEKMIDVRSGVSRDKLDQGTAKALERMQKEIDEAKKAQKAKDKQIASLETQLNESKAVKKTEKSEPVKTVKTNDENQKDLEVLKHASVEVKQDDVINDLINRFAPEDKPKAETEKQTEDEKTPEK